VLCVASQLHPGGDPAVPALALSGLRALASFTPAAHPLNTAGRAALAQQLQQLVCADEGETPRGDDTTALRVARRARWVALRARWGWREELAGWRWELAGWREELAGWR
jgi:hypothetical protein